MTFIRFAIPGGPGVALSSNAAGQIGKWIDDKAWSQRDHNLRELSDRIFDTVHSAATGGLTGFTKLDTSRSEMRTILEILVEHDEEVSHAEFVRLREALEDFLSR